MTNFLSSEHSRTTPAVLARAYRYILSDQFGRPTNPIQGDENVKLQLKERILVPTGDYAAMIESVENVDGQFGPQLKFTFKVENPDTSLIAWCSAKFTSMSKLYQWVTAIFGSVPPKNYELDTDKLTGRKVTITVIQEDRGEKGTINRITGLKKYAPPATPQAQGFSEYPA